MTDLKIKVDQLKNYLGTGLMVQVGSATRNLKALQDDSTLAVVTYWKGSREKEWVGIENIKPIVYRLSDLDKEIEVNGERFVPLISLAKNQYPQVDFLIEENRCIGRLNAGVVIEFLLQDEIPFYKEYHNNIFGQGTGNDFDDMLLANICPSGIREKLFHWHFWPFGEEYFEQGLVIDKMAYGKEASNG